MSAFNNHIYLTTINRPFTFSYFQKIIYNKIYNSVRQHEQSINKYRNVVALIIIDFMIIKKC